MQNELNKIEERAMLQANQNSQQNEIETVTFPLFFFDGLNEFKKIIKDSRFRTANW